MDRGLTLRKHHLLIISFIRHLISVEDGPRLKRYCEMCCVKDRTVMSLASLHLAEEWCNWDASGLKSTGKRSCIGPSDKRKKSYCTLKSQLTTFSAGTWVFTVVLSTSAALAASESLYRRRHSKADVFSSSSIEVCHQLAHRLQYRPSHSGPLL